MNKWGFWDLSISITVLCYSHLETPCIMCVQYRGGAQYHGVFNTMGYHEYHCGVQYCGRYPEYHRGYHEYHGGYFEYHGVFSTVLDIMINVGIS